MNNDTICMYKYKNWSIWGKTEYNKTWFAEAGFLFEEFGDSDTVSDFICNNRIDDDSMTTLAKSKKYIKENGDRIADELREELKELLRKEVK